MGLVATRHKEKEGRTSFLKKEAKNFFLFR